MVRSGWRQWMDGWCLFIIATEDAVPPIISDFGIQVTPGRRNMGFDLWGWGSMGCAPILLDWLFAVHPHFPILAG